MSGTANQQAVSHDAQTQNYFNNNTPVYSTGRYTKVVEFINSDLQAERSFIDLGCGTGNIIQLFGANTTIRDLAGMDIGAAYLSKCQENNPTAATYLGSILQPDLANMIKRRFGYVLVGAVLHHLVLKTRAQSFELSKQALANAWSLVHEGGCLVIMEPTFKPRLIMSLLFHVKRIISSITSERVSLFGYWNNLGEPVVSYMSHEHVRQDVLDLPGGSLVLDTCDRHKVSALWRLCGITERADSILILRKNAQTLPAS